MEILGIQTNMEIGLTCGIIVDKKMRVKKIF